MFDDLEYISVVNQSTSFPKHFHNTFCLSLISSGIEKMEFDGFDFYSESGSISITNPFEVHANPIVDKDIITSFATIYISEDLMKFYANGNIIFHNRKIQDYDVTKQFLALIQALKTRDQKIIQEILKLFIFTIKPYSSHKQTGYASLNFAEFDYLEEHIEHHILEKFDLDELSRITRFNKYGLIKKFKLFTGMSPMNYIVMRKIFSSKSYIDPHTNLTDLAYQYNFTDLAHFSKTFKQYVGIAPKTYQKRKFEK